MCEHLVSRHDLCTGHIDFSQPPNHVIASKLGASLGNKTFKNVDIAHLVLERRKSLVFQQMLHIDRRQEAFLHLVATCGDDDAAITADPRIVEDIDEHTPPFMIVTEQSMVLKTIKENKEQTRIDH